MTAYALSRADGSVVIMRIVDPNTNIAAEVVKLQSVVPGLAFVSQRIVTEAEIPTANRANRNAWKDTGSAVVVDPAKIPVPPLPETTPTTPEDLERVVRSLLPSRAVADAALIQAKKDRGKPF